MKKKQSFLNKLVISVFITLLSAGVLNAANYYVDPAIGSMSNNGSEGSPWSTLAAVFSAGKTFSAGDIIYLKSGNHGFPIITQNNSGDVIITAYPGNNPIVNRIDVLGASHWIFDNVRVYTSAAPPEAPVLIHPVPAQYNNTLIRVNSGASYITFNNCYVYSIENSSSWTEYDWNYNAWNGIYINSADHHITIDNCYFKNIKFGIHMHENSYYNTVRYTTIENISGDGMRIAEEGVFEYNTIKDFYATSDNHFDIIQGFRIASGVVIRGNTLISQTSSRSFSGAVQGIGLFDGMFDNVIIENNLIACSNWHGLSLYGARNCKIVNNTVVRAPYGSGNTPWIGIYDHKIDSEPANSNNILHNNISPAYVFESENGVPVHGVSSNVGNLTVTTTSYSSYFINSGAYDFRLNAGSPAVDAGTSSYAPAIDLNQYTRSGNPDVGCYELGSVGGGSSVSVTGVSVSPTSLDLFTGQAADLTETVSPANATNKSVTWSSNNTSVATVNSSGLVTAVSEGSATITVTTVDGAFTVNCSVGVTESDYLIEEYFTSDASNFSVIAGGAWSVSGGRYILSGTGDASAGLLGNISVHNTNVASDFALSTLINITGTTSAWDDAAVVFDYQDANNYCYVSLNESNDGNTKGIFKVVSGSPTELADITASISDDTDYTLEIIKTGSSIVVKLDGNQIASATDGTFTGGKVGYGSKNDAAQFDDLQVSVSGTGTVSVTGVSVSPTSLSLDVSQTSDLTETVAPANATDKSVTWSSNNTSVATVNSSGLVIAVGGGSATITVTTVDGGFTANCAVNVTVPVTGVSVSPTSLSLDVSQTSDLTETVAPANATDKSVTWSSNNTSVATVNSSGLVTAVGAGSATITVTTVDGSFTANCAVNVTVPVTGVSVSPTSLSLDVSQTSDLTETVSPANATDKSVTWSSNNTSVATVNSSGLVTAVSAGSAVITVTTVDGSFTAISNVSVSSPGYLIDEDFSSGASNFSVIAGGTWSVSGGRYVLSNPGNAAVGLLGNISVHNTTVTGDFILSTLVNITGSVTAWNDAAVVFNYQDANNYYYVSLNESNDGNTKGIFRVSGGVTTELADITATISSDTDYTLEIIKSGTSIVVKLDGNQIASATATLSGGKVGYGSKNDAAEFDNLQVTTSGSSNANITLADNISNTAIHLYPNPVSGNDLNVLVDGYNSDEVNVVVYDVMGRVIYNDTHNMVDQTEIHIHTNTFNKGIYIVSVQGDNISQQKSLIVK